MKRTLLREIAYGRSGDKGNVANIGIIAVRDEFYSIILREVTAEKVKKFFAGICDGEVRRYELPNLCAVNFVLEKSLDGGGTVSLRSDAQGKTLAAALLRMEISFDDESA